MSQSGTRIPGLVGASISALAGAISPKRAGDCCSDVAAPCKCQAPPTSELLNQVKSMRIDQLPSMLGGTPSAWRKEKPTPEDPADFSHVISVIVLKQFPASFQQNNSRPCSRKDTFSPKKFSGSYLQVRPGLASGKIQGKQCCLHQKYGIIFLPKRLTGSYLQVRPGRASSKIQGT
jgi:hypothetical protein